MPDIEVKAGRLPVCELPAAALRSLAVLRATAVEEQGAIGQRAPGPIASPSAARRLRMMAAPSRGWAMPEFETIRFEVEGPRVTITLNRPERINAFNGAMERDMRAAWTIVRDSDAIRVVVLTGAGDRGFCSGADRRAEDDERISQLLATNLWEPRGCRRLPRAEEQPRLQAGHHRGPRHRLRRRVLHARRVRHHRRLRGRHLLRPPHDVRSDRGLRTDPRAAVAPLRRGDAHGAARQRRGGSAHSARSHSGS